MVALVVVIIVWACFSLSGRLASGGEARLRAGLELHGLRYPSVECRRWRWYRTSLYAKIATRAAARVGQPWRATSSTVSEAKHDSATALSSPSPTEPVDGTGPAACRCWPHAREKYCPPPVAVLDEADGRPPTPEGEAEGGEDQRGPQVVGQRPAHHQAAEAITGRRVGGPLIRNKSTQRCPTPHPVASPHGPT